MTTQIEIDALIQRTLKEFEEDGAKFRQSMEENRQQSETLIKKLFDKNTTPTLEQRASPELLELIGLLERTPLLIPSVLRFARNLQLEVGTTVQAILARHEGGEQ